MLWEVQRMKNYERRKGCTVRRAILMKRDGPAITDRGVWHLLEWMQKVFGPQKAGGLHHTASTQVASTVLPLLCDKPEMENWKIQKLECSDSLRIRADYKQNLRPWYPVSLAVLLPSLVDASFWLHSSPIKTFLWENVCFLCLHMNVNYHPPSRWHFSINSCP